jgi:hypothetical protein
MVGLNACQAISPTTAPVMQVDNVPATMEHSPSDTISPRRWGGLGAQPADHDAQAAGIGEPAQGIGHDHFAVTAQCIGVKAAHVKVGDGV